MAFKEGALVYSQPGALPGAALEDVIGQLRALDMEHVRSHQKHDEQKEEPTPSGADRESEWHYHDGAPEPQHQNGS
jgi:hypothetical protein